MNSKRKRKKTKKEVGCNIESDIKTAGVCSVNARNRIKWLLVMFTSKFIKKCFFSFLKHGKYN